jgi:hypothetical protein
MPQKAKIPVVSIEELQRSLDALPEHRDEEVTKTQAIRMLAPQIHAMQSKGYTMSAIAAMLSDRGIAVTAVALKSYLSHNKERAAVKRGGGERKARRPPSAALGPHLEASPVAPVGSTAKASEARAGVPSGPAPAVAPKRPAASPPEAAGERRSAFVPRSDSDDI